VKGHHRRERFRHHQVKGHHRQERFHRCQVKGHHHREKVRRGHHQMIINHLHLMYHFVFDSQYLQINQQGVGKKGFFSIESKLSTAWASLEHIYKDFEYLTFEFSSSNSSSE